MAQAGETELFFINLEVGKCYEHAEATRKTYEGNGKYRYFTSSQPVYVGKFVRQTETGSRDEKDVNSFFNNQGNEVKINHSYEGNTVFREVECKGNDGGRRKSKKQKRKVKKTSRRRLR
jgi:hypothetical protein